MLTDVKKIRGNILHEIAFIETALDAEVKIGELMAQVPKQNAHNRAAVRHNTDVRSKCEKTTGQR